MNYLCVFKYVHKISAITGGMWELKKFIELYCMSFWFYLFIDFIRIDD